MKHALSRDDDTGFSFALLQAAMLLPLFAVAIAVAAQTLRVLAR